MTNVFEENNKFFSLDGIIDRRNFIVNYLIIQIIEQVIISIFIYLALFFSPHVFAMLNPATTPPLWFTLIIAGIGLISSIFFYSNALRRTRDILDKEDTELTAGILTVLNFLGYLAIFANSKWISFIIVIFLALQKGRISSEKPKNGVVKFNWGAFAGTWMWGLYNKTPLTLLMLPLMFTSAALPFMLICGLRGNEWSYKNKTPDSLEKFHISQANQSVLWIIFTPIIFVVTIFCTFIFGGISLYNYSKTHPDFPQKIEKATSNLVAISMAADSTFDKIELNDSEYKFYIKPTLWKKLSKNEKFSIFCRAVTYVKYKKSISRSGMNFEVENKTKIYSIYNNELLGEYYMPPNAKEKYHSLKKNKMLYSFMISAFKINENPTVP